MTIDAQGPAAMSKILLPIKTGTVPAVSSRMNTDGHSFATRLAAADDLGGEGSNALIVAGDQGSPRSDDRSDAAVTEDLLDPLAQPNPEQAIAMIALVDPVQTPAQFMQPLPASGAIGTASPPMTSEAMALTTETAAVPADGLSTDAFASAIEGEGNTPVAKAMPETANARALTTGPAGREELKLAKSEPLPKAAEGQGAQGVANQTANIGSAISAFAKSLTPAASKTVSGESDPLQPASDEITADFSPKPTPVLIRNDMAASASAFADAMAGLADSLTAQGNSDPSTADSLQALIERASGSSDGRQAMPIFGTMMSALKMAPEALQNSARIAFDSHFIDQLGEQISALSTKSGQIKLQITPEHLGRIDIEFIAGPKADQIRLVADNELVRQTLAQSQQRLELDLKANGQRAEVSIDLRQQGNQAQSGQNGDQSQPQQSERSNRLWADRDTATETRDTSLTRPAPGSEPGIGQIRYA